MPTDTNVAIAARNIPTALRISIAVSVLHPCRWIAAASIVAGWVVGELWQPPVIATAAVLGIVSGGIIAHTIKEELPQRSEERFSPWLAGAISYTALILLLDYTEFR